MTDTRRRWDTGANASWVGRGEVNIVQSITPSTGTVRLRIPLSHQYQANFSVVPTLQRISTPVRPVVKNIGLIIDTNPDGMYTGTSRPQAVTCSTSTPA
ncbi:hypothetical protein [Gordonia westfalica]|uniref:Uncharacterized protein n=1 Tax=Gordonia westfalica TaxID=158898 RepID=A0A1H2LC38_9ACTN|nr:hypothetical protein [Gordonia westfalica]SDU78412.1 hypothetical protein SAMN04488548_13610 [Gordonia westfalica]